MLSIGERRGSNGRGRNSARRQARGKPGINPSLLYFSSPLSTRLEECAMRKKSDAAAAACDVYTRIHFSLLLVRRGGRGSFPSAPRKKRCVIRMLRILSKVVQVSYSSYSCFLSLSRSREKEFKKKESKDWTACNARNRPDIGLERVWVWGWLFFRIEWRRSRKRCRADRISRWPFRATGRKRYKVAEICFTGAVKGGNAEGGTCHAVIFLLIRHRFVSTLKVYRICFPLSPSFPFSFLFFLFSCFVSFLLFFFLFFCFSFLKEREKEKEEAKFRR